MPRGDGDVGLGLWRACLRRQGVQDATLVLSHFERRRLYECECLRRPVLYRRRRQRTLMRLTMSALLVIVRAGLIRFLSTGVVGRQPETTDERPVRGPGEGRGGEQLEKNQQAQEQRARRIAPLTQIRPPPVHAATLSQPSKGTDAPCCLSCAIAVERFGLRRRDGRVPLLLPLRPAQGVCFRPGAGAPFPSGTTARRRLGRRRR